MSEYEKELEMEFKKLLKELEDTMSGFADMIPEEIQGVNIEELENTFRVEKPKQTLVYEKVNPMAVDPKYNYPSDSGFDLHSTEEISIPPMGVRLIPTGLKFRIPEGYEIQVRSKSGLALNYGLMVLNSPGTVDQGYTGEVKVILFNTNNEEYRNIGVGTKVAQAVLCPVMSGELVSLLNTESIEDGERGSNGFGSTGI